MSDTNQFRLNQQDDQALRQIDTLFQNAQRGDLLVGLLPFLSISGSLVGTSVSIVMFDWNGWAEAARGRVFRSLACNSAFKIAYLRRLEISDGVAADPDRRARAAFWDRMAKTLEGGC